MKKRFLSVFFILILCVLCAKTFNVFASSAQTSQDIIVEGAQVRTAGKAGIRFVGNVSDYDCTNVTKYGIILAFGDALDAELIYIDAIVNDKETINAEMDSIDENGRYYVTLYDVPKSFYNQKVSARAYVVDNNEVIYSDSYICRSLYDVVEYAFLDGNRSDFVKDVYFSVNGETYSITYNLNGGTWGYSTKQEMSLAFLKDFYDFVGYTGTFDEFVNGDGTPGTRGTFKKWSDYVKGYFDGSGVENKLLYDSLEVDDDNYFFNSSTYKEKWRLLADWIQEMNGRMYGVSSYFGGSIDFYRYIIDDASQYADIYGTMFNNFPEFNVPTNLIYKAGDVLELAEPYSDKFLGWYLNSDLTGEKVTHITADMTGDIELFAAWSEVATYELTLDVNGGVELDQTVYTVMSGELVSLPSPKNGGHLFDTWMYKDEEVALEFNYDFGQDVTLKATWIANLEDLVINDTAVTYRNSTEVVQIPKTYEAKDEEFRGAWVTSYTGDFTPSTNKTTMMSRLTAVLDKLEEYNMNAIVFHIRYMNNACYQTKLAPMVSSYGTYESFEIWDYLEWFIEECHNRGIQFHAWLNPYRIKAYGYASDATPEDVASAYIDYPLNAASNPDNILMTYREDGTQGAILNPCKEEVQDYIVDVCLEIMENYDIDAIHFDDYFYAQMSSGVTVLTEPDQDDYETFIDENPNCGYSKTSSTNKKQWRRDNVDNFIYKLHTAMTEFNVNNKRAVQLGIAPTGIYKNGNGSIDSGSNTGGQEHYSSYLFCDTKKWVLNEWIDYICPQTYWAITHTTAGYPNIVDWWSSVVEGTKVNLYTGMGIYMSVDYTSSKSWALEGNYEASLQVLYNTKFNNVKGTCIYSFKYIGYVEDESAVAYNGLKKLKEEYWNTYVPAPKTMADQYAE